MGRKAINVNPESGKRLSEWLNGVGMTQTELAARIGYTQQYISNVVTGKKNMSVDLARCIAEKVPRPFYNANGDILGFENVRPQWLLCLDDHKTVYDEADAVTDRRELVFNSSWTVLDEAARKNGMKILLNHPYQRTPSYIEQLHSQRDKCRYVLEKNGEVVQSFSVVEFIRLTQRLEKYADFLLWDMVKEGGTTNG